MGKRKHDDAHRPMGGKGQRGNRAGKPANWGGAELIEHKLTSCSACCMSPCRCAEAEAYLARNAGVAGVDGETK